MAAGASTDIQANKAAVTEFLEAFSSGDIDRAMTWLDDSATWWTAGAGTKSKAEFSEALKGFGPLCKAPLTLIPSAMTAEGDRVAVEADSHAELTNGRTYDNQYHLLFVLRDGKIVATREYLDTQVVNDTFAA